MNTVTASACVGCGAAVTGRYCSQCGEAVGHHDYSLKHFAEEALETFAHVDGRVFSTFRVLVLRPGQLVSSFLAGRRKAQMGPLQLFVICNVIYFLVQPLTVFVTFTSTVGAQIGNPYWGPLARTLVTARANAHHLSLDEYARHFDETAHLQGKSLVILMVPLFALGAWALFARARRFYAEHLVFAFYTFAFMMLWMAASTLALSRPVVWANAAGWSGRAVETTFSTIILVPFVVYLLQSARHAYGESGWRVAVKAAGLSVWAFAVLMIYRFILLFTSLYAT